VDVIEAHTDMHTFDTDSKEREKQIPTIYKCRHLPEDAREIQRARRSDTEVVHTVRPGNVAKCVLRRGVRCHTRNITYNNAMNRQG
jgi:hypothetical protein